LDGDFAQLHMTSSDARLFAKRWKQLWGGGPRLGELAVAVARAQELGNFKKRQKAGWAYRVIACLSRSAAPEDEAPVWEAMVGDWRVEGAVPTLRVERVGTRLLDLLRM
jgi:hypothetical protein